MRTLLQTVQHTLRNAAEAMLTGAYLSREARQGHGAHVAQLLKAADRAAQALKSMPGASWPLFETGTARLELDGAGSLNATLRTGRRNRLTVKQAAALLAFWMHQGTGFRFAGV